MTDFKRKARKDEPVKLADIISGKKSLPDAVAFDLDKLIRETEFDVNKEPTDGEEIIFLNGQGIGSRGNIVCVTGPAKSRKTVITSSFVSSIFSSNGFLGFKSAVDPSEMILHFDTEQGYMHYYNSVVRMFRDAGVEKKDIPKNFKSHHTRGEDTENQVKLIEALIERHKPTVVIIDGIADLMDDINDQKESKRIANMVMRWAALYNMVVIVVIHVTPGEAKKMRGAVGTYLLNKCETVIMVEKDKENKSISNVTCQASRNREFPPYAIKYNEDLHRYDIVDAPKEKALPEDYSEIQLVQVREHMVSISVGGVKDSDIKRVVKRSLKEKLALSVVSPRAVNAWVNFLTTKFFYQDIFSKAWLPTATLQNGTPPPTDENKYKDDLPF